MIFFSLQKYPFTPNTTHTWLKKSFGAWRAPFLLEWHIIINKKVEAIWYPVLEQEAENEV